MAIEFKDNIRKVLNNKAFDGGLAGAANWLTLPKGPSDILADQVDREGSLAFDTDLQQVVVDTGSGFVPVGGGGAVASVNGQTGIVVLDASDVSAANTTLSNLGTITAALTGNTAVNISGFANITADSILKGTVLRVDDTGRMEKQFSKPSGGDPDFAILTQSNGQSIGLFSVNAPTSGYVAIETGNAAAGNSGVINIQTGTASGTRGEIILNGSAINVSNNQITNLADPTLAQDAATKAYVDSVASTILAFQSTATVGGAVQETVAVTGLLATDTILSVSQRVFGAATRTSLPLIGWSAVGNDTITLDWIADPGPGAIVVVAVKR